MKPTMFIGSSVEGLEVAEAVQESLQHIVDTTIWTQGVFGLSTNTMDALTAQVAKVDFATFILSPDDVATMREKDIVIARDNVLFELGLFTGVLGIGHVFFVVPIMDAFHLPTDLNGITPASYTPGSHSGNVDAALGSACTKIKKAIRVLLNPAEGLANLSGKWSGKWDVKSQNFPLSNTFTTDIKQVGSTISSSILAQGISYAVKGEIHRGGLITGIWGNPNSGATYFGPFQLVVSPCGMHMNGKWSGFTRGNTVESGDFFWSREKDEEK